MELIKKETMNRKQERLQDRPHHSWYRATSRMLMLAVHEADALRGHLSEHDDGFDVARRTRSSDNF